MTSQETIARIETLRARIAWTKAGLECLAKGADPESEKQLASDRAELAALLAKKEAA